MKTKVYVLTQCYKIVGIKLQDLWFLLTPYLGRVFCPLHPIYWDEKNSLEWFEKMM